MTEEENASSILPVLFWLVRWDGPEKPWKNEHVGIKRLAGCVHILF